MVWHRMAWYPFTCLWYGILSDGMACIGSVIAWLGIANSGMDIAGVRVGKVWQETLHLAPLFSPLLTLTSPTLACLASVLGLLCARVWGCAFGLLPVLLVAGLPCEVGPLFTWCLQRLDFLPVVVGCLPSRFG